MHIKRYFTFCHNTFCGQKNRLPGENDGRNVSFQYDNRIIIQAV